MTAREAHLEQWRALKDKPLSDKMKYIFTYYWAAILGGLFLIIFVTSWIGTALSQKDSALSGYLLNGMTNEDYAGNLSQEFIDHQQIDSDKYDFKLFADTAYSDTEFSDTNMAVMESIVVKIYAKELDFIVVDYNNFPALTAYYTDLREVLKGKDLEKWQDSFVYVEKEALKQLTDGSPDDLQIPEYHPSSEGLVDPIPLGIRLPADCRLMKAYMFPKGDVILGIPSSCANLENLMAFLDFITE